MSHSVHHQNKAPSATTATTATIAAINGAPISQGPRTTLATGTSRTSVPDGKRRRASKMKVNKQLSRSASTPQMRESTMSDSELDKKRNKLGYQRISIACAHCRRRKIRCLVAEGDPQHRCQNCIRLKKECVFYPVEQQSAMENRSQPSHQSGPDSGPSSVVSSSPQTSGSERPFEQPQGGSPFHAIPSSANAQFQGLPLEPGSALPVQGHTSGNPLPLNRADIHTGGLAPSHHSFRPPEDHRMAWDATEQFAPDHMPVLTSAPQEYWGYNRMRAPGDFAPFPSESPQAPRHPQFEQSSAFAGQQEHQQWQHAQQRSMSYGNIEEDMRSNGAVYGPGPFQQDYRAPPNPLRYPPSSLNMHTPMLTQGTGPHSAPVGAPITHQSPYAFSQDQHNPVHAPFPPHPSYPGQWYADPSSFGPLEEEPDNLDFTGRSHPPGR